MMMKKILVIIGIVFTIAGVQAQKEKSTDKAAGIIKNPSTITIYEVDPIPVLSVEQVKGAQYIHDYPIKKGSTFNKKMSVDLITAVQDTSQYMSEATKMCPFMGKYAVTFKKGNQQLTILISTTPCDKVIIFCEGSFIDKTHMDLKDKSKIIYTIEELLKLPVQGGTKK